MSPPHTWFGASTNWIAGPIHEPFRRWFGCRGKEEPAIPGGSRSVPARRCHRHAKKRGRLTPRQRPSVLLVSRCVARIAVSRRNVLCDVASRKIRGTFFYCAEIELDREKPFMDKNRGYIAVARHLCHIGYVCQKKGVDYMEHRPPRPGERLPSPAAASVDSCPELGQPETPMIRLNQRRGRKAPEPRPRSSVK